MRELTVRIKGWPGPILIAYVLWCVIYSTWTLIKPVIRWLVG